MGPVGLNHWDVEKPAVGAKLISKPSFETGIQYSVGGDSEKGTLQGLLAQDYCSTKDYCALFRECLLVRPHTTGIRPVGSIAFGGHPFSGGWDIPSHTSSCHFILVLVDYVT